MQNLYAPYGAMKTFKELRQHRTLRYTKYICEKVPLSEPKFSQDLLLPNYAVLP